MQAWNSPSTPSSFSSDKPLIAHLNIDLILSLLGVTFFHPFFAWLLPLAYRAQAFHYHHAPLYWSSVYAMVITILYIVQLCNRRLGGGWARREFDWSGESEEVVVITGGASGLGGLLAAIYGMRGVSVAVLDVRDPEEGEPARNVRYYKCDVTKQDEILNAALQIEQDLGKPTVLINNAAVVNGKSILSLTIPEIENTFQTNFVSHYRTIQTFLPAMLVSPRGGVIVSISSAAAHIAPARLSDYSASKAAVRALHETLTAELADHNSEAAKAAKARVQAESSGDPMDPKYVKTGGLVKTLLVSPGQLSTPMFAGVETPNSFFAPVMEPVEVAKAIIVAVDKGAGGELSMPAYSHYFPVLRVLPVSVQRLLRWASGVDKGMDGFVGRQGSVVSGKKQ